jgi:4a-hydroxytetrahydrobiopterin dehydratase
MTRPTRLTQAELDAQLKDVPGWAESNGKLHRELKLGTFRRAFALMTKIAAVADDMDHHPEWFNVYDRLRIDLATHDAGGISALDIDLAKRINQLLDETP